MVFHSSTGHMKLAKVFLNALFVFNLYAVTNFRA